MVKELIAFINICKGVQSSSFINLPHQPHAGMKAMNYLDALNWRYAVKEFSNQTLSQTQIDGLVESVRLSASAYGMQPYKLLIVESAALKNACLEFSYGQNKVVECSHLLVLANYTEITADTINTYISELAASQGRKAETLSAYKDIISQDILSRTSAQQSIWAQQQCYIALGKLLSYAAIHQIDAGPMTGFDTQGINQVLGLDKQGLNAAILCPVGIRSKNDSTATRPKFRKTTEQLVVTL